MIDFEFDFDFDLNLTLKILFSYEIPNQLRVENVVDTPLPLLVTPACDAAELAFFIRQCKFHSSIWRANQTEQGVTDGKFRFFSLFFYLI